ncbi:glycosyl hydrolase family 28-related protein [Dictyobacter vulcani]|nr:glycosyl hydrolase family 28-related protein [Dictyobacter vulcani]
MGNSRKKIALITLGLFIVGLLGAVALLNSPLLHGPQSNKSAGSKNATPQAMSTSAATQTLGTQRDMVLPYDQMPGAAQSSIKVAVDGEEIFVEKYKDINYARFAFRGTAQITITSPNAASYTISPKSYQLQPTMKQNTLTFALNQPRKLILQGNDEKLFLFADAPEENAPALGDHNVIDVTKYASDRTGNKIQTAQIQQAIDDASKTQGIVYFPQGKYVTGTLKMKSNMSLYLSSGALLSGSGNAQDTAEHFLLFQDVQNSKLYGRGTIDLHGMELRRTAGSSGRVKIIRTINAKKYCPARRGSARLWLLDRASGSFGWREGQ